MNYENLNLQLSDINIQKKHFFSVFGLYLFSLGSLILGYSFYLLLESIGLVTKNVITWNGQGLLWFLVLFCVSIFILFLPIEFLNIFKIYNSTFKDLILNIMFVIGTCLVFLIVFQFLITPQNSIVNDVVTIGKAVSFSGFIAIPLVLFLQHNLKRTREISDSISYNFIFFIWILASQIFL
jgi:hypothetical protein|tara:strand:+ start:916 stop:1458 length:543 start_codon:yes stop_codon:yes gene_type:complete